MANLGALVVWAETWVDEDSVRASWSLLTSQALMQAAIKAREQIPALDLYWGSRTDCAWTQHLDHSYPLLQVEFQQLPWQTLQQMLQQKYQHWVVLHSYGPHCPVDRLIEFLHWSRTDHSGVGVIPFASGGWFALSTRRILRDQEWQQLQTAPLIAASPEGVHCVASAIDQVSRQADVHRWHKQDLEQEHMCGLKHSVTGLITAT